MLGRHSFSGGGSRSSCPSRPFCTRREIITKCGAGLAAIIAAGRAPAALIRSAIAMRNAMMAGGGGGLSAKSYVQDGLIAMWDGIENAGWGVHDPNATTWVDLTGNGYDLKVYDASEWEVDGLKKVSYGIMAMNETSAMIPYNDNGNYFEVVLYNPSDLSNSYYYIFNGGGNVNGNCINTIVITFWNSVGLKCVSFAGSPWSRYNQSYSTFPQGVHHITVSYSGSTIDGIEGTFLSSGERYTGPSDHITLGASEPGFVGGILHSLRIYSNSLDATARAANYAVDKARFNLP